MKRTFKQFGTIAHKAIVVFFFLGICISIPLLAQEEAKIILPGTVKINEINGEKVKGMGNKLGNAKKSAIYSIPTGQNNFLLNFGNSEKEFGQPAFLAFNIDTNANIIPDRTYAVIGEAKWGSGRWSVTNQGARLYIADATDDSLLHIPSPKKTTAVGIRFSPDGSKIAITAGKDINIHNTADGTLVKTLKGHSGVVYALNFDATGEKLFSVSADETVRVWTVNEDTPPVTIITKVDSSLPFAHSLISWNADASLIAIAYRKNTKIYETETGKLVTTFGHDNIERGHIAFSPDSNQIITVINPSTVLGKADIVLWETRTGKEIAKIKSPWRGIHGAVWHPDGNGIFLALEETGTVLVDLSLEQQKAIKTIPENPSFDFFWNWNYHNDYIQRPASSLLMKPNSKELLCITTGRTVSKTTSVNLINADTGDLIKLITSQTIESSPTRAVYSNDGKLIAFGSKDGVRIWNSSLSK